jgi:hypothetical protein
LGDRDGARTHDPLIKSQMLYRLSYAILGRAHQKQIDCFSNAGQRYAHIPAFQRLFYIFCKKEHKLFSQRPNGWGERKLLKANQQRLKHILSNLARFLA